MTKILEIKACKQCAHLSTDMARNCWRCTKKHRSIHTPDTEIPGWCPLENTEEQEERVKTSKDRTETWWTTRNHAFGCIPDEVKLLLNDHAAEQRQMCADAVIAELRSMGFQIYQLGEARIRKACLGATGEE